jgi:hypothetical protein
MISAQMEMASRAAVLPAASSARASRTTVQVDVAEGCPRLLSGLDQELGTGVGPFDHRGQDHGPAGADRSP